MVIFQGYPSRAYTWFTGADTGIRIRDVRVEVWSVTATLCPHKVYFPQPSHRSEEQWKWRNGCRLHTVRCRSGDGVATGAIQRTQLAFSHLRLDDTWYMSTLTLKVSTVKLTLKVQVTKPTYKKRALGSFNLETMYFFTIMSEKTYRERLASPDLSFVLHPKQMHTRSLYKDI